MKKSKKIIKTILVLPLVLGLLFSSFSSFVFASQTGTLVATVSINPLTLQLSAPSIVQQGRSFRLRAQIGNLGQSKIKEAEAIISVPSGLIVKGAEEKKVGIIRGGREKRVSWQIKAKTEGIYIIQVEARGRVAETGDLVTTSETVMVKVMAQISFLDLIRQFLARA